MNPSDRTRYLAVLPMLLVPAVDARAEDWFHLDRVEAEAIATFDGLWRSAQSGAGTNDVKFEESVRIRQSGYSLDPRIVSFSLEVEPTFSQGKFTSVGLSDNRKGRFLNYNTSINVLQGAPGPFSFLARASRSSGLQDSGLGGRTEFVNALRGATVNWRNAYMPLRLSYEEIYLKQLFTPGLSTTTSRREEKRRTLVLSGRSRKTNLRIERQWLDDRTLVQDRDYTINRAQAGHTFKWGKGSSLRSSLDYYDRNGFNPYMRFYVRENASVAHLPNLTSAINYGFSLLDRDEKTIDHRGSYRLTHDLYENLRTDLNLHANMTNSRLTDEREYEGSVRTNYRKTFFGAEITAGASGAYRLSDRESSEGFISVVDESQTMPLSGVVLLDRRFIDNASIIVTLAADGAILTDGVDYDVFDAGDDLTEIRSVPGGRAGPNEQILFSYEYQILPSMEFSTTFFDYNISIDYGWIKLSHSDSRANERLKSVAGEGFLNDRRVMSSKIELEWQSQLIKAKFGAERRLMVNGDLETRTISFNQIVRLDYSRDLNMSLTARQSYMKSNFQDTDLYTLEYSAQWTPTRGLVIRPRISGWVRKDRRDDLGAITIADTQILTTGLDVQWRVRKFRVDARYTHIIRGGEARTTGEDRIILTLRRKY